MRSHTPSGLRSLWRAAGISLLALLAGTTPLYAQTLKSLALSPSITCGGTITGTVTLTAAAGSNTTVTLVSGDPTVAAVPGSVVITAGSATTTFTFPVAPRPDTKGSAITATLASTSVGAQLVVVPPVTSLAVSARLVSVGLSQGTITLGCPAPVGGATVQLSSDTASAIVPASVTVFAGQRTATFPIRSKNITATADVTLSATYLGISQTALLRQLPRSRYTLTDLGPVGSTLSSATGIGNLGIVAGYANDALGNNHAFRADRGGQQALFNLQYSYAANAFGDIAGQGPSGTDQHGLLVSGSQTYDLQTLFFDIPSSTYMGFSNALGLNDAGQVVGYSSVDINNTHGFLYAAGALFDLGALISPGNSYAQAINNNGQIVGTSDVANNNSHAFVVSGGTMSDLGTLSGSNSAARAINDLGQIAGFSDTASTTSHAFLFSNSVLTDLGTLRSGNAGSSNAYGLNNNGQVVGYSETSSTGDNHAFEWQYGVMTDLNTLIPADSGYTLTAANGINDRGWIVGDSTVTVNGLGEQHAFLLKPTVAPYDFYGDGQSGLLWQNTANNQTFVWRYNGTTYSNTQSLFVAPNVIAPIWNMVGSSDFNGDGKNDVIWQNQDTNAVIIWYWNGGAVYDQSLIVEANTIPLNYHVIGTADLNGDGWPDLIWQDKLTGDIVYYLCYNNAILGAGTLAVGADLDYKLVGVGDFNGDGKADLVWQSQTTNLTYVWYLNGTTVDSAVVVPASRGVGTNWHIAGCPDLNGDGSPDLLWQNAQTNETQVWLMNSTTLVSKVTLVQPNTITPLFQLRGMH